MTAAADDLRRFAVQLHGWGARVVAMAPGKKPLHPWAKQEGTQTRDEVAALPWARAAAVAVVCGGGWRCFDVDALKGPAGRPVGGDARRLLLEGLGLLPDYQWAQTTPSGGVHVFFRCDEPRPDELGWGSVTVGQPLDGLAFSQLELRWTGCLATVAGPGYGWLRSGEPFVAPARLSVERVAAAFHAIAQPAQRKPDEGATPRLTIPQTNGNGHYGQAALADAMRQVATAAEGTRNATLFRQAAGLLELANGGELAAVEVERGLLAAGLAAGLERKEIVATLASAGETVKGKARTTPSANGSGHGVNGSGPGPAIGGNGSGADGVVRPDEIAGLNVLAYRPEDGGVLDCWDELHGGEWRYATGLETWYRWVGTHWAQDDGRTLERQLERLLDEMNNAARKLLAATPRDDKEHRPMLLAYTTATRRTKGRVASVEYMAKGRRAKAARQLDQGDTLNLANGTLELETLELRPHHGDDLLTYCLPYGYRPDADCPRWRRFLDEVLVTTDGSPDRELATVLQELFGYSVTTDTSLETMGWLMGLGANGKSVTVGILQKLLGPLATVVDFHTLGGLGNYDLAKLLGKRVAFSTESTRGGFVAEGYLKRIVSGETIATRPIYGHPIEFRSMVKVWWAMNDRPIIRDSSDALWRRMQLIPFNRTFARNEQDHHLAAELERELPGILNWALEGLRRLRANGRFTCSTQAAAAVDEFRHESNPVLQWREERTITTATIETAAADLYTDYSEWAKDNGREALNSTNFGRELVRLPGVVKEAKRIVRYNLRLNWAV